MNHFLSLLDELDQLVTDSSYGRNNLQALEAARGLTGRMRSCPEAADPYIWEKIGCLENWLSILYSQRKHVPWGGAERILALVRHSCTALRNHLAVHPS
ncbi:hypothetical protein [Geminicoccus harenae]|uniref:hypothetical protein n=1 Tax=Geminicoccus harenae TaxID=2498453 RepID=UPI00168A488E|nr:hypothetical protein [Geminicoccus harenae]